MSEDYTEIESALRSLRPRSPSPAVTAGIAHALQTPVRQPAPKKNIIVWMSSALATAACLCGVFLFSRDESNSLSPEYQLVSSEQSPAAIDILSPVELSDGSYARPVRLLWNNTTHWADAKNNTQLIDYRPAQQLALIPVETY
jgi:hypothetical protein